MGTVTHHRAQARHFRHRYRARDPTAAGRPRRPPSL